MCEHGGFQLTALLHSASAQEPTASEWCGVNAAESLSESTFEQVPVINLHQSVDQMYISGKGFGSSETLSVDIHLLSGGAMGAAYSLPINSIEAGAFTSHPTGVFCEAPNDRLFVLVMDGEGNEHARIFEPGEFRCPAA